MQTRTNIIISCFVGAAVLAVIAIRGPDRGPAPAIAEERIPSGEARDIERMIGPFKRQAEAPDGSGAALPGAHQKHHGCVRAEFAVIDNLAPELSVGIFQPGARYRAWIRFSNNADPQLDAESDVHSMAIKLLGIDGKKLHRTGPGDATHDIALVSHPVFPFPDVASYAEAFEALAADKAFTFFFNPFDPNIKSLFIEREMTAHPADLLDVRWWSMVPYRFGDGRAVKYSARPCSRSGTTAPDEPGPEYLRGQLSRRLVSGGGCFEFMLQLQTNAETMPIEDASVEWDEVFSPFEPVALLTIGPQRVDTRTQRQFCENLSYNPWQAPPEHRPLGGINRARREIYAAIAEFRHDRNPIRDD